MGLRQMTELGLIRRLDLIERYLHSCSDKDRPMWNRLYQSVVEELARRDIEAEESSGSKA